MYIIKSIIKETNIARIKKKDNIMYYNPLNHVPYKFIIRLLSKKSINKKIIIVVVVHDIENTI